MDRRLIAMLLLTASACQRPTEEARPAPAAKSEPSELARMVANAQEEHETTAVAPLPATAVVPRPRLSLGERLVEEARTRPERAPRVEVLREALESSGVAIVRTRQVLASAVDARYCALLASRAGLAISVCEYDDAQAAARGRARSHAQFDALMPGRTLVTHANALMTLSPPADPRAVDEATIAERAFAALAPSARP